MAGTLSGSETKPIDACVEQSHDHAEVVFVQIKAADDTLGRFANSTVAVVLGRIFIRTHSKRGGNLVSLCEPRGDQAVQATGG